MKPDVCPPPGSWTKPRRSPSSTEPRGTAAERALTQVAAQAAAEAAAAQLDVSHAVRQKRTYRSLPIAHRTNARTPAAAHGVHLLRPDQRSAPQPSTAAAARRDTG